MIRHLLVYHPTYLACWGRLYQTIQYYLAEAPALGDLVLPGDVPGVLGFSFGPHYVASRLLSRHTQMLLRKYLYIKFLVLGKRYIPV